MPDEIFNEFLLLRMRLLTLTVGDLLSLIAFGSLKRVSAAVYSVNVISSREKWDGNRIPLTRINIRLKL